MQAPNKPPPPPPRRDKASTVAQSSSKPELPESSDDESSKSSSAAATTPATPTSPTKSISDCPHDMHGFVLKGGTDFASEYSGWQKTYSKKQSERGEKWTPMTKRVSGSLYTKNNNLKKLVRKGIPNRLRGKVWMDLSGATEKMAANPGLYQELLASADNETNNDALAQIELDLHRTFPDHPQFNLKRARGSPSNGEKIPETAQVQSLRRVLRAYACRNSFIGYCQGMNFIAGIMLLFLEEESVFWLLSMLLETILPPDYYSSDLIGCNVDLRVFGELMAQKSPKVAKKFAAGGIGVEFFALEWFISLFSKALPSETVLRIWDCLFFEGDKILFRVALGIVSGWESRILAAGDQNDLFQIVQEMGRNELDADALLKLSFGIQMKRDAIHGAREHFRVDVERERQSRANRSNNSPPSNGAK